MSTRTKASIHTSDVINMTSEHTGGEYRISISLPAAYDHKPEVTFPAVYVLDGNLHYEIVTGISRLMALNATIPEVAVISIGYPLEGFYGGEYQQFFIRRAKDLTAVIDKKYHNLVL